jgi:hypothetical protein
MGVHSLVPDGTIPVWMENRTLPWVDHDDEGPAEDIVDPQDVPGGGPEDHLE